REIVGQWQSIQMRRMEQGAEALRDRWHRTELRTSMKEVEFRLKMQHKRLRALMRTLEPYGA
ncbi:MAG: hypothetical protein GW900_09570, partial [Gammaproteobacteria bacterium]|nr:hypothetical protein [Gammaproteobacteria bacterium]